MGTFNSKANIPSLYPESRLVNPTMFLKGDESLNSPCRPYGIAIQKSTKHVFVTDTLPFGRVSVFTSSFNFITTFNHPKMMIPCGVAVQEDNFYVTDKAAETLFHYWEDSGFCRVSSTIDIFSGKSQFLGLRELALSHDGKIYLVEFYNFRVQVLDSSDLSLIRYISHPSLLYPVDLYITTSELYVLALTTATFCVKVFSLDGELLRSIVRRAIGSEIIISSLFFCLDTQLNIIITDSDRKMIKIFSNQGKHIYSMVLNEELKAIFLYSRGLALTRDSSIIVASVDCISEFRYPVIGFR